MQGDELAQAQGGVSVAQIDGLFVIIEKFQVPAFFIPGETLAGGFGVILLTAAQPDLVTVVDAGSAGVSHLEQDGELEGGLVATHQRDEAGHIVAVQEVELGQGDFMRVQVEQAVGSLHKPPGVQHFGVWQAHEALGHLPGDAPAPEKAQAQLGELVVHHRVELVPLEPALGLPGDLANQVCFGVGGLHHLAELLPEGVVVDLERDVQPPAVDPLVDPVASDLHDKTADLGVAGVELGQGRQVVPAVIRGVACVGAQGKVPHIPPVHIWGSGAQFQQVVELEETAAGVVEDTIQHDAHPPPVGLIQQGVERPVSAQDGIDPVIVVGVIAVVGGGLEDGVKVDGGEPEVLEIVEALGYAEQVAAFEAIDRRLAIPGFKVGGFFHPFAPGEAVGKDLVENGVFDPTGGLCYDGHRQS